MEQASNLPEHSPSRLISNAHFTLNLFGRDSATGRGYAVDSLKPSLQRSAGLVEDSAGSRIYLMAAMVTLLHMTAHHGGAAVGDVSNHMRLLR